MRADVDSCAGVEFVRLYFQAIERLVSEMARCSAPFELQTIGDELWPLAQRTHALQLLEVATPCFRLPPCLCTALSQEQCSVTKS
jgi:hypothetical protein